MILGGCALLVVGCLLLHVRLGLLFVGCWLFFYSLVVCGCRILVVV